MVHSGRAKGGDGVGIWWTKQKRIDSRFGTLGKFLKLSVLLCLYYKMNSKVSDKC